MFFFVVFFVFCVCVCVCVCFFFFFFFFSELSGKNVKQRFPQFWPFHMGVGIGSGKWDSHLWLHSVSTTVVTECTRKFPKYSDTQNICCNHSKIWTMWLYHRVMSPNDADGMANSVDPDQRSSLIWVCTRHICPKTKDHYGKYDCGY